MDQATIPFSATRKVVGKETERQQDCRTTRTVETSECFSQAAQKPRIPFYPSVPVFEELWCLGEGCAREKLLMCISFLWPDLDKEVVTVLVAR